jgi:hypothetical protein
MTGWLAATLSVLLFAGACGLLALCIRHFIPLVRGLQAPTWAYALGPAIFLSDRYLNHEARPHRERCLIYFGAFATIWHSSSTRAEWAMSEMPT